MREPQSPGSRVIGLSINEVLNRMLAQSNQLAAFSEAPLIRDTVIDEEAGKFDAYVFANSDLNRSSTPRSSVLQTGTSSNAPLNLDESGFDTEVGVAQPLITGGELRLSQHLEFNTSNSEFFIPDEQSTAALRLELRQPLLDGAGTFVNLAPVEQARLERNRSIADFRRQIESQFVEVLRTYWTLYAERSRLIQLQRLAGDLDGVAKQIEARTGIDTLPAEEKQAQAALRRTKASIIRSQLAINNNEARLSALLSDPSLFGQGVELIPIQVPVARQVSVSLATVSQLALTHRSEVEAVQLQIQGAKIALEVAENGLLPQLDVFGAAEVNGLAGGQAFGDAINSQFGGDGYDLEAGVRFRAPIGNTTDDAIYGRRVYELRQLYSQEGNVHDTVLLEAQVSVSDVQSSYEQMLALEQELDAVDNEVTALGSRAREGLETGTAFLAPLISTLEDRQQSEERPGPHGRGSLPIGRQRRYLRELRRGHQRWDARTG